MTDEVHEIVIDIIQRWLEQDSDPPSCRLLTRTVFITELVSLKIIYEQKQTTYQNASFQAGQRWQQSLELRASHSEQLVNVPFLAQIKIKYGLERLQKLIDSDALAGYTNWCNLRGWTDLFVYEGRFWAFPPCAVLPLPIQFGSEIYLSNQAQEVHR
ncbi:hypothetical protein [Nostoc parmelioides]|uniref:Uncharacterized protein n=1 Tax=Nostoc parmelioides FACHB-3921 TaxID=2692909 RepID=A0ABR8BSQ1_9NOSO|nr:hypothetical protein [Nostoc parmelioides]MBD2255940.1 hypothetical protein [Nostoc parmelioides FACHB-3921]